VLLGSTLIPREPKRAQRHIREMSTLDGIKSMHADVLDATPESDEDKVRLVDELKERGNLAVKAKRWEESDCLYSKAIELGPTHALYSNRSMARLNLKKYADAATDADECIQLDPGFAKGYYRKAQACEKLRDWGPAYDAYKGCLERTKKGKEYDKMQKASEECYKKVCKQMREGKVSVDTTAIERETTAPAPQPTPPVSAAGDGARKERAKKMDTVVAEGEEGGDMKGYKIVNGKKTSYFHTELTDEAKALLEQNAGPKKLDAAAVAAMEQKQAAGGGSAWNSAKTFEEKDMTKWSKDRLTAMVKEKEWPFVAGETRGDLHFKKAKSVGGDASTPVIRGTKRYLFDLNVTVQWEVAPAKDSLESVVGKKLKGEVSCADFSTDCEGEYDLETKIVTKDTEAHSDEVQRAAREQAKAELKKILDSFVEEFQQI
jgi:hypothetical protein